MTTRNHLGMKKWRYGWQHSRHWKKASDARLYSSIFTNLILKPISKPKQDGTLNILQKQKSTANSSRRSLVKVHICWMHWNLTTVGNSRLTLQGMITYPLAELGTLESMIAKLETLSVEDSNNLEGLYKRSIFISISFFMIQRGEKSILLKLVSISMFQSAKAFFVPKRHEWEIFNFEQFQTDPGRWRSGK